MRSIGRVNFDLLLFVSHGDKLAHALLQLLERNLQVAYIFAKDLMSVDDLQQVDHLIKWKLEDALKNLKEPAEQVIKQS